MKNLNLIFTALLTIVLFTIVYPLLLIIFIQKTTVVTIKCVSDDDPNWVKRNSNLSKLEFNGDGITIKETNELTTTYKGNCSVK